MSGLREHIQAALFVGVCIAAVLLPERGVFAAESGDRLSEARRLKTEADGLIQRAGSGEPALYADALRKLYRAMDILEVEEKKNPAAVERLMEEVSAATFWARKFMPLNVHAPQPNAPGPGKSAAPPPAKATPAKTPSPPPKKQKAPPKNTIAAAEAEYRRAEKFAAAHKDDPYAVALRWFQMASEHAGNDWALKALAHARDAQARYRARKQQKADAGKPTGKTLTPEERSAAEAERLLSTGKYKAAQDKFLQLLQNKNTAALRRRLGHAYYKQGLALRAEYSRKYLAPYKAFCKARNRRARYVALQRLRAVQRSLNPLANRCLVCFGKMREAFSTALRLSGGKDLESAAHIALSYTIDPRTQGKARRLLADFLSEYKPTNDEERTLYSYCETELARMKRLRR